MKKSLQLKLIMILAGIIIAANKVTAQTPIHLMNSSGTIYSFTLEEKPRFWHSGQLLHLHTDNVKISFVLNKVAQIFWDNDIPTSISATAENKINFSIRDGKLYVSDGYAANITYSIIEIDTNTGKASVYKGWNFDD